MRLSISRLVQVVVILSLVVMMTTLLMFIKLPRALNMPSPWSIDQFHASNKAQIERRKEMKRKQEGSKGNLAIPSPERIRKSSQSLMLTMTRTKNTSEEISMVETGKLRQPLPTDDAFRAKPPGKVRSQMHRRNALKRGHAQASQDRKQSGEAIRSGEFYSNSTNALQWVGRPSTKNFDDKFFWMQRSSHAAIDRSISYLGVVVDAVQHHFPIDWMQRLLDEMMRINYNLLILRIANDQAVRIRLATMQQSRAFSMQSPTENNEETWYYTRDDLRTLVQYARQRNITIVPELTVPTDAGGWASFSPGLVTACPKHVCDQGLGIPLNLDHPKLELILENVFQEVIELFNHPSFVSVSGTSSVDSSKNCLLEAGIVPSNYRLAQFHERLQRILSNLGYPPKKVIQSHVFGSTHPRRIVHYSTALPDASISQAWMGSVGLNLGLDISNSLSGMDFTEAAVKIFRCCASRPMAIIVDTSGLNMKAWLDQNVVGRMLGVAIGVAEEGNGTWVARSEDEWSKEYLRYCTILLKLEESTCQLLGRSTLSEISFRFQQSELKKKRRFDVCQRLTEEIQFRNVFKGDSKLRWSRTVQASDAYWNAFARPKAHKRTMISRPYHAPFVGLDRSSVRYAGVILDVVHDLVSVDRIQRLVIDCLSRFGFNLIQLRLANDHGFAMELPSAMGLSYSLDQNADSKAYDERALSEIVDVANHWGMEVMPEISISTNAAGWYKGGFLLDCPKVLCKKGRHVVHDIGDHSVLPVLAGVIRDLRRIFGSQYLHLGSDERNASQECIVESGMRIFNFDRFERKIAHILSVMGVPLNRVLRWENQEKVHYRSRAGNVTHYTARNPTVKPGQDFFTTVQLLGKSPWMIFQDSRHLASIAPTGILAEVPCLNSTAWVETGMANGLLAFAMGISESTNRMDQISFHEKYFDLCRSLDLSKCESYVPNNNTLSQEWQVRPEVLARSCADRTVARTVTIARATIFGNSNSGL